MPLSIPPARMPQPGELMFLLPEMILALWGVLVLVVDLTVLRRQPEATRRRLLGAMALTGSLVSALACVLSMRAEFPVLGRTIPGLLGQYGMSFDLSIFAGTLSGDSSTVWLNLALSLLLALAVGVAMSGAFTDQLGEFYALMLWSTVGMMVLAASEELLTLFLALETMTICLYLLTAFEKSRRRSAEGGLKYFVYGSVASALFLFGLSLIYGLTGSTRLSAIRQALAFESGSVIQGLNANVAGASAVVLILVGFGFKIAAAPFHQWAPDAYEGAPAAVGSWIGSGSKLASFVALAKVLVLGLGVWSCPPGDISGPGWIGLIGVLAALSMTYGNLAALAQRNLKRLLGYSSIAHAGYLLVGVVALAVSTGRASAAGALLYYLVTYSAATIGAFALAAWMVTETGSDEIDDLNGLGWKHPFLAVCLTLLMLSLIGLPPLAGFVGKLAMFMHALNTVERERSALIGLVALGFFNSVISAFYYVKILRAMFLRPPARPGRRPVPTGVVWGIVVPAIVVLGFGLWPRTLLGPMQTAAVSMLTPGLLTAPAEDPLRPPSGDQTDDLASQRFERLAHSWRSEKGDRHPAATVSSPKGRFPGPGASPRFPALCATRTKTAVGP